MTSSLRWPLAKDTSGTPSAAMNRWIRAANTSLTLANGAVEFTGQPSCSCR